VVCFNSISFVENLVVPENENICLGQEINIDATIPSGNSYSWSPTIGVSDAEIANPDFSPTETTDYTVTIADNCGELTNYTVTIAVSSISTPTFAQIAAICVGDNLPDLPTTSTNGISGTWSPAMNNIATTTYAFTPDAGECSTDLAEMTVIVNTSITPTFTQVAAIFNGETLAALPTTSNNNITGTWSPAINNTETTTYTFTPDASQTCAINQTMMITVTQSACEGSSGNQLVNPSFEVPEQTNIGNNIQSWPLNGWNGVGSAPNVVKVNGVAGQGGPISAQDGVQYLDISGGSADFYQEFDFQCNTQVFFSGYFSVRDGQSSTGRIDILRVNSDNTTDVVASSNQLDMPSTANIWYLASGDVVLPKGTYRFQISMGNHSNVDSTCFSFDYPNIDTGSYDPLCESSSSITLTGTPTDSFGTWTGSGVVDNGDGTASFNPSGLGGTAVTVTYSHFNASGFGCSQSTNITVNPLITPTFTQVDPICNGEVLAVLPTTSTNGVTGTWSPALDNTATTIYTFVPDTTQPGQACAVNQTMTITVNQTVIPIFDSVAAICEGESLTNLPTTSNNSITGTWSPAMNNTETTNYTFTPDAGQCAITSSIDIVVNPIITPFFNKVNPIRSGDTLNNLPSTSNNGIEGTWSPAMNNTATTNYTFTPNPGQCAATSNIEIVISNINNAFSPNGDGVNDIFIIPILFNYLDFEIEVFNRWGTKVYYYNNNGNTSPSWWDGYATVGLLQGSSKPLTVGTYYYIIHLNNKVKEKITGWIYLNR
jgi:gliding motility-associated-like protein